LPTEQRTSLNLGKFQTCVSTFKFGSSFASAQLARALRGFLSMPTCLPPVLAGGSTVKSSSPNKSWSRIPVNRGRDAPQPSLADSESLRAAQQRLGRQSELVPAWTPLAGSVSHQICIQLALSRPVSCRANMGIREILVDIRTSDVMARAGVAAAAQDVRNQPERTVRRECRFYWLYTLY
jgi:hypothetical protein